VTRVPPWLIAVGSLAAIAVAFVQGCSVDREDSTPTGVHPAGWADLDNTKGPDFHAKFISDKLADKSRDKKDPLADCRTCHGEDYLGGAAGVSCASAKCHTGNKDERPAVAACNNCHGDSKSDALPEYERGRPTDPLDPTSGAHKKHGRFCNECHNVPKKIEDPGHTDTTVLVNFSGMAVKGGLSPAWDKASGTCTNVYCHGGSLVGGKDKPSPVWTKPTATPTACDACHKAPPDSHKPFARLAGTAAKPTCASCHPEPDFDPTKDFFADSRHIDGVVQMSPTKACATCHGTTADGAPPVAVDGSTTSDKRGVGAHQRHLDSKLGDRLGRAVPCDRCHNVPTSVTQPGHMDAVSPVRLGAGESFDKASGGCVNDCHFGRTPGPVWNDNSGAARKCDACHAFPPDRTRKGTIHPAVAPDLAVCTICHRYAATTHVDGRVDFNP
jgi:predicted CxxxxCH...CXXCH cytochrome family protein